MLKDHSRDHINARDSIKSNHELVKKYTKDLQKDIGQLQEILTAISWYLDNEMCKLDMHYNDMPLDHLKHVNMVLCDFCSELLQIDTAIRQSLFVINHRFDMSDDGLDFCKMQVEKLR